MVEVQGRVRAVAGAGVRQQPFPRCHLIYAAIAVNQGAVAEARVGYLAEDRRVLATASYRDVAITSDVNARELVERGRNCSGGGGC